MSRVDKARVPRTSVKDPLRVRRLDQLVRRTILSLPNEYRRVFIGDHRRGLAGRRVTSRVGVSIGAMRTRVAGTLGHVHRFLKRRCCCLF